ncbi:MAG: phosphoribosyltransferase [Trueperaceae bacterium]|nr:phosphoribosyltransferase [Trueperaceae bacterium]
MTAVTVPAGAKVALPFTEIARRIAAAELPRVDLVIGVATGGVVPAALLAYRLGVPLARFDINYRAPDNSPRRPAPELLAAPSLPQAGTRVLLVDDVTVSGQTLGLARALLAGCEVTTLALKGRGADIVLFPEVASCVAWPWHARPD